MACKVSRGSESVSAEEQVASTGGREEKEGNEATASPKQESAYLQLGMNLTGFPSGKNLNVTRHLQGLGSG